MKGINCILANAQTKKLAAKYNLPESIVKTIQQTVASERKPDGLTSEEFIEQRLIEYNTRLQNSDVTTTSVPRYMGDIIPNEDTVFVFGSNPEGIHGAGSAKVATTQFGAKYGQGEGIQGDSYALPTKRVENIPPKLKGDMSYNFNGRQREGVVSSSTIEAIINKERTATTRYESDGNIEYWQQAKVGDIIEFHSKDQKTKVYVRVTKPLTKLDSNTNSEEWSKKEGWSSQYFNYAVKPKIKQAYQMEFEYVGAYGERTVTPKEIIENIKKLYATAASNSNKKFKIAYRNKRGDVTLNGYSGQEMMNMFLSAGPIPSNVLFSEEWALDPYFATLYREINGGTKLSSTPPILKKEFQGKLIVATPGTGKTTIADNVNIIDGDYILAKILDVPVSLVIDAWELLTADEKVNVSGRYVDSINEYLKQNKTVITSRLSSLPIADYIIYRGSASDTVEITNRERSNRGISKDYANVIQEAVEIEISKRGSTNNNIRLNKEQYLSDIILENPNNFQRNDLQGVADRNIQGKSLNEIIADFLEEFGIETSISREIVSDIDVDILNKIVKAKKAEDLPTAAGEIIAYMSLYHPKMIEIVASMMDKKGISIFLPNGKINDKVYKKSLEKGQYKEYTSYIGKYMGQVLREEYGERRRRQISDTSLFDKIISIVRDIISKLREHKYFIEELDATCRTFATHIFASNPYYIQRSLNKPGTTTRAYLVDAYKALAENPLEKEMIVELQEKDIYIGGSLAMAFQGSVYRPLENPMHDLDFDTNIKTKEELEKAIYSIDRYKEGRLQYVRTQESDEIFTYTYIYLSEPFTIEFINDSTYEGVLKDTQGIELGKIQGNELILFNDNIKGKVLDFFVHPSYTNESVNINTGNNQIIKVNSANVALAKKIEYGRLKDLFDYNRYISKEFKARRAKKQQAIDTAFEEIKINTLQMQNTSRKQQMFKAIDPNTRIYRYKRIATDFIETLYNKIDEIIEDLEGRITESSSLEQKQTLMTKLEALKGDNPVAAYLKYYSADLIFNEIKGDYSYYIEEASDKELLTIFPTKNPRGAEYIREQVKLMLDNFDALVEESLGYIEEMSGISITLNPQISVTGDTTLDVAVIEEEGADIENTDVDEDTHIDIGGGNSFKVRMRDNFKTLTTKVKKVLSSIIRHDTRGNIEEDDLGTPLYMNARNAHGILIDELSSMINSKDFCVRTENSDGSVNYTFPALEKTAKKYPWVNQIIETLQHNPRLIGAFYSAYRKDFIKRFIYKTGKGIVPSNETSVFNSAWKELNAKLEEGQTLTKNSVYGPGIVYKDKLVAYIDNTNKVIDNIIDVDVENKNNVIKVTNKVVESLAQIGVKVNPSPLKEMIVNKETREKVIKALKNAIEIAQSIENSRVDNTSLMTRNTRSKYINILRDLNIANDTHTEQMYRQGGKSKSSYTVPGYLETLFKKLKNLKGKALEEFMESEFKSIRGPFYSQSSGWMNSILSDLANPKYRATTQAALETAELESIEGVDYESWTPTLITRAFVSMFLDGDFAGENNTTTKADYTWYNAPIFSDSPVVKFIKLKRYKKTATKTLDEIMMPLFVNVVKQELMRIKHIEEREKAINEGKTKEIANYDKKGKKLFYFPELNASLPLMQDALRNKPQSLNKIIEDALKPVLKEEFENWLTTSQILQDKAFEVTVMDKYHETSEEKKREILWDYYLNQTYATSQIIQLLVTDPAFYSSSVDFQKRFKEVYAAGTKLNTQTEFGKEFQRAVILKDRAGVSSKLETIKQVLNQAVSEGRILSMDRDNILNKLKNFCATDGQAFRSLSSLKSLYDMMGVLEDVEESLDRIVKGKWDMKDFYTVFQTLKPFIYTSLKESDGLGSTMRVGHQEKDSEYISLLYETIAMGLNLDTEMQAIQDFMEEKGIDIVVFESGVKTGGQGPIDIYNTQKVREAIAKGSFIVDGIEVSLGENTNSLDDIQSSIHDRVVDGDINQEQANMLLDYFKPTYEEVKGILNNAIYTKDESGRTIETPGVIKNIPTEDYCITMSTSSEHLVDSETIYGTQFNTLIVADLTDDTIIKLGKREYKGNQIKEFYHSLKIENLLEDFEAVKDIFKSPKQLVKEILKRVDSNAKYNKGIKEAIKLVQKKDPVTGSLRISFAVPLNNPTMKDQLQEIVLSIFKNKITKQKIKGGTAYLVSDIGFTDELQIAYKKDANGNTYIDYIPCYLPCTAKEMFKDILVERSTLEGVTYYELDINAKDENGEYIIDRDLLDLVGYRIPTEHKYSMAPLRVVGFLPQQNGSSIMLPAEAVIVFSGADFDIDKLFLMMYEYYKDEYNRTQGKKDYDKLGSSEISFEEWWKQNKKNYARKQPLYRKLKYDYTQTPEQNSRKQRNNALIDVSRNILRNHTSAEQILRPQGFDSFIRGSALTQIIEDPNIITAIMQQTGIKNYKELSKYLLGLSNDGLNRILKDYKQEVPLLSPRNFLYYHSQNMAGGNSLGAYANNTTRQAKYQGTGLSMAKSFKFNGRVVAALDQIYTTRVDPVSGKAASVLITQNCCEGVGASADNAKTPTISTMRQQPGLIRLSGLMLSAGLSMDDIALFFSHPIISNYIDKSGTLEGLEESLGKEYRVSTRGLNISNISLTSDQLLELSLIGNNANTEEEYEEFVKQSYPIIKLVATLWRAANDLSPITKVSRVDSVNGAISHNFGGASTQRFLVDEVHRQSKKEGYSLVNLNGVPENFGKDILQMSKEELRKLFSTKGNPFIQACHTLGIEAPQHILAEYFSEMSESMQQHLDTINHDAPGVTINPKLAQSFLSYYVIYRLGTFDLFRTKGDFLATRDYYLNEFPKEFKRIVSTNEDIGKIEVLQRLHLSGKGIRKTLRLEDANLITEIEAERLRTSFDELLYLDNPLASQLAVDLFVYTYFANSLAFLPHSLTRFFSPEFLSFVPGYIEKLKEIEEETREGIKMREYTEYWYNNTMRQSNLRSYTLGKEVNLVETEEGKVYISTKTKNIGGDWRYRIKLKTINPTGNTYSLLKLDSISGDGEKAYYVEVPSYVSMSFYNPDMNVEDSIKEVKKREEEFKEAQEQEVERAAWIAGVDNTFNEFITTDGDISNEDIGIPTDSNIDSVEEGGILGEASYGVPVSELEAFYTQDSVENDRLC